MHLLIFIFFTLALSAFGNLIRVGSKISIDLPDRQTLHSGIFLGKLVQPDGTLDSYMFLDERTHVVYYAQKSSVNFHQRNLENILKLYDQQGNTCTGYAMNNLLHQMNLAGFEGNRKLKKILATEEGRTQLLADAINQYYLVVQHRYSIQGILNHDAVPFIYGD